ncbi:MAG: hypothetical protein PUD20_11360 [bacterium]|nr:hypothetical protein [bacterium]
MFNPSMIFEMKNLWDRFERNHPKFPRFLQVVGKECIQDGTVIEISVTKPDGQTIASNIRLNAEDMELIETMRNMGRK